MNGSKHFSPGELACKCGCGTGEMDSDFLEFLEVIRCKFGKPMVVSSAYRCADYNDEVSSTGRNGPHTTGKAIDIRCYGPDTLELFEALPVGLKGLGIKQTGPYAERFIHIDTLNNPNRPWCWGYA